MMLGMQRGVLPWLLAMPLMTAGSLAAHSLAYRIVEPGAGSRRELLDATGHGYLAAVPLLSGALFALVAAAAACYVVRATRGRSTKSPSWPLMLVPPLGFAIQEHVERFLVGAGDASFAALEPTFLVGLALQAPFALVALFAARRLARVATELGKSLAAPRPLPSRVGGSRSPRPVDAPLIRHDVLALGYAERGPPS